MAASTLRYEQRGYKVQETNSGVPVNDRSPSGFLERAFRTLARYHSTEETELWKLGGRLVKGLTGEALKVPWQWVTRSWVKRQQVPVLVNKVKKHISYVPFGIS